MHCTKSNRLGTDKSFSRIASTRRAFQNVEDLFKKMREAEGVTT